MRKKSPAPKQIAKELPFDEIIKILGKIGELIHAKRLAAKTSQDTFSYETKISKSGISRYEAGRDMTLSSFLRVLYGLDIKPEDFFIELRDILSKSDSSDL